MLQQPIIWISYLEQIRHIPRIMIPIQQMSERHRNWPGLFTRLTEKTKPAVRWSVQHRRLFKPTTAKSWDAATRARNREGGGVVIRALKWRPRARAKWITSPQIERSLCVRKLVPHAGFRARGVHWSWGAGERCGWAVGFTDLQMEQGNRRSRIWQTAGRLSWEGATWKNVSSSGEAHRAGADWKISRFPLLLCGRSCGGAC